MKVILRKITCLLFCTAIWLTLLETSASAQELKPRLGIGFNAMVSTPDGLGFGLLGRASAPINADLSLAVDLGFTGFVLGGRDDASYVFTPQISAIITLPYETDIATYLIAGFGGYVPLSEDDSVNGPTIHFGIGRVQLLRETTLFYEVDPGLIIGERGIHLTIPGRIGVIF